MKLVKAYFYLKPVITRTKWHQDPIVRHVHYVMMSPDYTTTVERPAKLEDAIKFPRQFGLYLRRLKGPRGGMRKPKKRT